MSMSISNGSLDLNRTLQRSQTPMAGGVRFAIRNLRFGMIAQSNASGWEHVTPWISNCTYCLFPLLDMAIRQTENEPRLPWEGIMSRRVSALSILAFGLLAASSVLAQKTLTATEAKGHIGGAGNGVRQGGKHTLGRKQSRQPDLSEFRPTYPDQVFYAGHLGDDRSKFDNPEMTYRGKRVCVTGKISAFKAVPEDCQRSVPDQGPVSHGSLSTFGDCAWINHRLGSSR